MADVAANGARSESALGEEVVLEGGQQHLGRRRLAWRIVGARQHSKPAEHVEQAPRARPRQLRLVPPTGALHREELLDQARTQLRDGQSAFLEPRAEPRHLAQLMLSRPGGVAALGQPSSEVLRERGHGPRHQHLLNLLAALAMAISFFEEGHHGRGSRCYADNFNPFPVPGQGFLHEVGITRMSA
jgi:hypothetical protein